MIFKEKYKISLKDVGKNNKIKNRALLEMLEDTGGYHSDYAGCGINDIKTTKLSWIILDWKLKVINRAVYGDELEVQTWARGINKFFTYRDYEIYNQDGKLVAIATSKWVLLNIDTNKMARITEDMMKKYHAEEKSVFSEEKLDKLEIPTNFTSTFEYEVKRRDIDINKHMHNLYYLDIAYEALPQEIYDKRPFTNVRITYKKEIKLNDKIICNYAEKDGEYIIVITNKENKIVHSIIKLS